jgi:NHL repeat
MTPSPTITPTPIPTSTPTVTPTPTSTPTPTPTPIPTPTPQTGTLLVTSDVTCPQGFICPQPSDFTMHVTGNNPDPSSFAGSSSGTTVTLDPGNYHVIEEDIPVTHIQLKLIQHFSADCTGSITIPDESKSCNVVNEYRQQQYIFSRQWGSFGTADGQFEGVVGIAINPSDRVYTSNSNGDPSQGSHHRIQEFTSQGEFITKWGSAGGANGQFIDPFGIAFDSSGNVYVADQVNQRIQKFTSDGIFIKSWGISVNPTGIAVDSHDNVYVTVQFSHFIAKFTADGVLIKSWGTQGTGMANLNIREVLPLILQTTSM